MYKSNKIWIPKNKPKNFYRPLVDNLSMFPDEIIISILSFLTMGELLNMSQTCMRLLSLSRSNCLWKIIYDSFWNTNRLYFLKTRREKLYVDISDKAFNDFLPNLHFGMKTSKGLIIGIGPNRRKEGENTIWFLLDKDIGISYWDNIGPCYDDLSADGITIKQKQDYYIRGQIDSYYQLYRERSVQFNQIMSIILDSEWKTS